MTELSLDGGMIPRAVKRRVDARLEERVPASTPSAALTWRGCNMPVQIVNVSPSGAMVIFPQVPHIGERVTLQLTGGQPLGARVCWVRNGRVGVCFDGKRG